MDTIPVDPYVIALSANGTRLYGISSPVTASTQSAGTVQVVDTATNTQVGGPIPVGYLAEDVVVNPTMNRAYVTALQPVTFTINGQQVPAYTDGLVVLDTTTNKPMGSPILIGTGQDGSTVRYTGAGGAGLAGPNVVVSPDGTRVYVAETLISVDTTNLGSGTIQPVVFVYDTKTNTQVGNPIPISAAVAYPQSGSNYSLAGPILISPSGDRLYASAVTFPTYGQPSYTYTIHPINPATGAAAGPTMVIDNGVPVGLSEVLSPDGKKLYIETVQIPTTPTGQTSNTEQPPDASVLTYDTTTGHQVGIPIAITGYGSIAVSPDGKTLYVADVSDSRTDKTGTLPGSTQSAPVGSVTAYDASTGAQLGKPVTVGLYPASLAINSVGTKLYVANAGDDTISVIDITPANTSTGNPLELFRSAVIIVNSFLNLGLSIGQTAIQIVGAGVSQSAATLSALANSGAQQLNNAIQVIDSIQATASHQMQDLVQGLADVVSHAQNALTTVLTTGLSDALSQVEHLGSAILSAVDDVRALAGRIPGQLAPFLGVINNLDDLAGRLAGIANGNLGDFLIGLTDVGGAAISVAGILYDLPAGATLTVALGAADIVVTALNTFLTNVSDTTNTPLQHFFSSAADGFHTIAHVVGDAVTSVAHTVSHDTQQIVAQVEHGAQGFIGDVGKGVDDLAKGVGNFIGSIHFP